MWYLSPIWQCNFILYHKSNAVTLMHFVTAKTPLNACWSRKFSMECVGGGKMHVNVVKELHWHASHTRIHLSNKWSHVWTNIHVIHASCYRAYFWFMRCIAMNFHTFTHINHHIGVFPTALKQQTSPYMYTLSYVHSHYAQSAFIYVCT